jgi:hypothetical protein
MVEEISANCRFGQMTYILQEFWISNVRRVLNLVCFLLGISPAAKLNLMPGKYPKENIQNTLGTSHRKFL